MIPHHRDPAVCQPSGVTLDSLRGVAVDPAIASIDERLKELRAEVEQRQLLIDALEEERRLRAQVTA